MIHGGMRVANIANRLCNILRNDRCYFDNKESILYITFVDERIRIANISEHAKLYFSIDRHILIYMSLEMKRHFANYIKYFFHFWDQKAYRYTLTIIGRKLHIKDQHIHNYMYIHAAIRYILCIHIYGAYIF